ncbi:hypothetical protein [Paracoccus sp. S3-43]|uniref:hypothetical protein n=1 Tax=Paracoccus sp. S3-43 TaxID=3030011 RepID=UPI0023AE7948|nr:hypothetical protein [Paracoccus sp. S3-43]WEF23211.1 hypothetical protein PXD02_10255 [Paracoccus sp. S3-43]
MEFYVRITLPEAPGVNLAEKIAITGFASNVRAPIPPETEMDVLKNDLADHLVSEGIVSAERRDDLLFDFG